MWDGNSVPTCRCRTAKLTGQIMWLTLAFAVFGEGFGAWVVSLRQGRAINNGNRHEC